MADTFIQLLNDLSILLQEKGVNVFTICRRSVQ